MNLNLQGRGVVNLHLAAAEEDGRYAMSLINTRLVKNEKGEDVLRCEATDGRMMSQVDLVPSFGVDAPGPISQEAWAACAKLKPNKKGCNGPEMSANGKVSFTGKTGELIEFERPAADREFPKVDSVIPDLSQGSVVSLCINAFLLHRAALAIGTNTDDPGIKIQFRDPDQSERANWKNQAMQWAKALRENLEWRPEPFVAPTERLENESDEAFAARVAEAEKAHNAIEADLKSQADEAIRDHTWRLIVAVESFPEYPTRGLVETPVLVTRSNMPEARSAVMPICVE